MKTLDLTHTFTADMPVYPGDPIPTLERTAEIRSAGYNEFKLTTGMHVGTHMDAPLHMIDDGSYMSDAPIDRFIARGRLIDARHRELGPELLDGQRIEPGDILLVLTGWYSRFRQPNYYDSFPEVPLEFARRAIAMQVAILGLDTPSPDRPPFSVHKALLGSGIYIIENLTNLESLVGVPEFRVIALPAKIRCEAAPVRVIAQIPNHVA